MFFIQIEMKSASGPHNTEQNIDQFEKKIIDRL